MKKNSTVVLKFASVILVSTLNVVANADAKQMTSKELADWATQVNQRNILNMQRNRTNISQNSYTLPTQQSGSRAKERYPVGPPTFQCVLDAARRQNVPFDLLLAVNSIERGSTGQEVGNTNGTQDLGAFQINTTHLPRLAKFNATREDIARRGCYNAEFAALLLNEAINHPKMQHLDYYSRAAGYHSWTPEFNVIYRDKLIKYHNEWKAWLGSQ